MKKVFSELLMRIEKFLTTENKELTANEKAVMNTVLSDFKGSIKSGQFDRYIDRKYPVTFKVFYLEFYKDDLMYFKRHNSGFEVKSLRYKLDTLNFERLRKELEDIGLKVKISRYYLENPKDNPMEVFFTVPIEGADP